MSKKKKINQPDKREAKKAAVLGTEKNSRQTFFIILACVSLIASLAFYFMSKSQKSSSSVSAQLSESGNFSQIAYPANLFEDGKARHFEFKANGMTIKYFIIKSSDGVIRAAFDACDVCWPEGKGYYQEGDSMVCRNCGRRFASVLVNEVKGGCNPAPLTRSVEDGKVIIKVKDILEGKQYFNFSGRI